MPSPSNEQEFDALMREVDQELAQRGVARHQRPFHAGNELSRRFSLTLNALPPDREPREGVFTGDDLVIRVHRWYEERYAEGLSQDLASRRIAVGIRDDIWLMKIPIAYGQPRITTDPNASSSGQILNVLVTVEGLGGGLRDDLSERERDDLKDRFVSGLKFFSNVGPYENMALVDAALRDLATSVDCLTQQPPHFGQARWSSLQVVEKLLKAYVDSRGGTFPHSHDLEELATLAEGHGLAAVDRSKLQKVQCEADVRYEARGASRGDALDAHRLALEIGGDVLVAM